MNKDSSYKTKLGGISSILIIAILVVFFFSNVMDFLNKTEIIFTHETIFSADPDVLMMNS